MPDRSEDLRREAARCFESAQQSKDPHSRKELIGLGHKFLELAASAQADFGIVLEALTNMPTEPSEPIVQQEQQQQAQPPKKED